MENETYENSQEEEFQETAPSAEQTENDGQETVEILRAEVAKYKAISERNKKKLTETKTLKTNETSLSREEGILIAQGMKVDELDYLNKIKGDQSYLEAKESDDFKNWMTGKQSAEAKVNAQLGASNGSPNPKREKTVSDLSDSEFKNDYQNIVDKALKGDL